MNNRHTHPTQAERELASLRDDADTARQTADRAARLGDEDADLLERAARRLERRAAETSHSLRVASAARARRLRAEAVEARRKADRSRLIADDEIEDWARGAQVQVDKCHDAAVVALGAAYEARLHGRGDSEVLESRALEAARRLARLEDEVRVDAVSVARRTLEDLEPLEIEAIEAERRAARAEDEVIQ